MIYGYDFSDPLGLVPDAEIICATHGPMKHRFKTMQWVCVGFDGEPCDVYLTDEEAYDVSRGRPIARVAQGEFAWVADHFGWEPDMPCERITLYGKDHPIHRRTDATN